MTQVKDKWEISKVECPLCTHTWIAQRPLGTKQLECPNCHNICKIINIKIK